MGPTYTPISNDEETVAQNNCTHARTRAWVKVLWVLQALLALFRILLVALILLVTFITAGFLHPSGLVLVLVWILLGFDIWLSGFIIVQAWQQLFVDKAPSPRTTLRREAYKAAIATYLFITFLSTPKDVGSKQDLNEDQQEQMKRIMRNAWMVYIAVVAVVIALFYPPLCVAWRDWRVERGAAEERGVELGEQRGLLVERRSVDTLDGLVEPDADNGTKTRKQ